jgi:hypothetical protein
VRPERVSKGAHLQYSYMMMMVMMMMMMIYVYVHRKRWKCRADRTDED